MERDSSSMDRLIDGLLDGDSLVENEKPSGQHNYELEKPTRTSKKYYYAFVAITCVLVLLIPTTLSTISSWKRSHARALIESAHCGNTSTEARARNCHFEPMQRSWIPHECYFSEPSDDYDPFGDREWFYDEQLTQKLSDEDLALARSGDLPVACTRSYHAEHCLFNWRKLAIAVERRLPAIDTKVAGLGHTRHCALEIAGILQQVVNQTYDPNKYHTRAPVMYQGCVALDWSV